MIIGAINSRDVAIVTGNSAAPVLAKDRIVVVQRDDYVYLVPFVEDDKLIALKTIIPSRKATKRYLGKETDDHEA